MDLWLIKIDEREHWCNAIKAQTTENFGVYVFDRDERTFCCELTPSYCLAFVANDYTEIDGLAEHARNALNEDVLDTDNEPVTYMHVRDIEWLLKEHPERAQRVEPKLDVDADLDWNARIDAVSEAWSTGALMF